jgi:inhibitor of KinA sporulation pathway (predicted exonuclease)
MPIRDIPYLSLDLELNPGPDGPEIIQVGVCIGSPSIGSESWVTRSWYLRPVSETPIEPHITRLTGISDETLGLLAVPHAQVAGELSELIRGTPDLFVNPVQWGLGDAQELLAEFAGLDIHFPHFGRRVIDVKHYYLYLELANGRSPSGGLRSSMGRHGLQFTGTTHRADWDAYNTLRFFFHLLRRQESLERIREEVSQWKR